MVYKFCTLLTHDLTVSPILVSLNSATHTHAFSNLFTVTHASKKRQEHSLANASKPPSSPPSATRPIKSFRGWTRRFIRPGLNNWHHVIPFIPYCSNSFYLVHVFHPQAPSTQNIFFYSNHLQSNLPFLHVPLHLWHIHPLSFILSTFPNPFSMSSSALSATLSLLPHLSFTLWLPTQTTSRHILSSNT